VKFLHAADIHLDSPLAGLSRRGTIPAHVTRDCTRRAFANLIDLAISEDVAFVIIAGDLYDGDWRDFSTGLFFAGEMRRLGRPCFLIRGNHDAASVITRSLEPPPNVQVMSARRAETIRLDALGVAIHGQSFSKQAVPEDLAAGYPAPVAGMLNIGVLHTSANDPGEHETYAPCTPESLALKGYAYWALGHIHLRATLHERPWIVFPGNIQGRNPRETGAKGCMLVETSERRIVSASFRPLDVLRWHHAVVDAAGAETMAELEARLRFALEEAQGEAEGRPLIVRITLAGATSLHASLVADTDAIDAECRNAAASVSGEMYVERVRLDTAPPAAPVTTTEEIAGLHETFLAALDDLDIQARLLDEFRDLAKQFPRVAGRPAPLVPTTVDDLRGLAPEAWLRMAHALTGTPTQ
jgi:DNA repair exonuclease SbcCD nuclease subunit